MSRTRAQVITLALKKLRVMGAGQTVDASDYADVNDLYEPTIDFLTKSENIAFNDIENISNDLYIPLATYLACEASGAFSTVSVEGEAIPTAKQRALMMMQKINAIPYTGATQDVEHF